MKIRKSQLKQIIKEEVRKLMEDVEFDFSELHDGELIDMAEHDGIEEFLVFDGDGGLANREEVIAALEDIGGLDEVSSEKQRRWACAQKDKADSERADSLSAKEAEEMCTSKVEEDT